MKATLLCLVVLLAAGCGGPGKTTNPADLVPSTTRSLVIVRSSEAARGRRVLAELRAGGVPRIPRGAGPQLVAARLGAGVVYLTQPANEKAFLAAHPLHAKLRGWVAFADAKPVLDAVRHRHETLSERPGYADAVDALPSDAAVRTWAPGPHTTALSIDGRDAKLEVHTRASARPQAATLADEVPADALAAAGGSRLPKRVVAAMGLETAGWVRGGLPFPELTVVSQHAAVKRVEAAIAKLAQTDVPPVPFGSFRRYALGAIDIFYGSVRGKLVVTDDANALSAHGARLALPELPDRAEGWIYVDVEHALPAAEAFAAFANWKPPAELLRLKPFARYLAYSFHEGGVETVVTSVRRP